MTERDLSHWDPLPYVLRVPENLEAEVVRRRSEGDKRQGMFVEA